jgi:hypothetical protein
MTLCDYVLIEAGTNKVSLIGCFSVFRARSFPFVPLPFCVFAPLAGGMGEGRVELTVTEVASDLEVYSVFRTIRFPDRFTELRVLFRLAECQLPAAGSYLFTLLVDGEWVAHRRIRVSTLEESS